MRRGAEEEDEEEEEEDSKSCESLVDPLMFCLLFMLHVRI